MTAVRRAMILVALAAAPAWSRPAAPESFELGRDGNGDPCAASREWSVAGKDGIMAAADQPLNITCRGPSPTQSQGYVETAAAAVPAASSCGAAREAALTGLGQVAARQCFDPRLQLPVVDVRFSRGGRAYHGAAVAAALGPLEAALRVASGAGAPPASRDVTVKPSLDAASLAPAPVPQAVAAASEQLDLGGALQQGVGLIRAGRFVEASRLFNDALRQFAAAPPLVRAELELNAALADSNISQFDAAALHFRNAERLLAQAEASPVKANLESERIAYQAIDLVNRGQDADAIRLLQAPTAGAAPLRDPVRLALANQPVATSGLNAAASVGDEAQLAALQISAERNWALSVANLRRRQPQASAAALDEAVRSVRSLLGYRLPSEATTSLRVRLQRQRGRIAAVAGRNAEAVASYDCAIAMLQGRAQSGPACLFPGVAERAASPASGPLIAEIQIERANLIAAQPGVGRQGALAEYEAAVDTLVESRAGGNPPPALAGYLDLLLAGPRTAETEERYFRALQLIGEPGIAVEIARLQTSVAATGPAGSKLRERADLDRQLIRLRYAIADEADPARRDQLGRERQEVSARFAALDAELGNQPGVGALDQQPVTLAELRTALKPGEAYFKLAALGGRLYAAVVAPDRTILYAVTAPARDVAAKAETVMQSARSYVVDGATRIRPFRVKDSHDLFAAIAGPAAGMLAAAKAVVFDPAGALRNFPAAILVTDQASVDAYAAQGTAGRMDFSRVRFLGAAADLSISPAPRTFLLVRNKVAASSAPKPFIGLGENAPAPIPTGAAAAAQVPIGSCRVGYARLAANANEQAPVSAAEIRLAASELGVGQPPMITGAAFTDQNVLREGASAGGDLAQYQVIHFATHGIPATPVEIDGCDTTLPPSLITSLAPPTADGGTASDGLLSFDEVARLQLDANLVVLSACETAAGTGTAQGRGAGYETSEPTLDGLVRAFITARARAVLATFWRVPASTDSEALIGAFYRNGRSAAIGTALREAQLTLMRKPGTSHPYYWGAYFVVGDGAKTMLSGSRVAAR